MVSLCKQDVSMVPVRIKEDNYASLEKEALDQRRSITAQLNVILDDRYGNFTQKGSSPSSGAQDELEPPLATIENVLAKATPFQTSRNKNDKRCKHGYSIENRLCKKGCK